LIDLSGHLGMYKTDLTDAQLCTIIAL